MHRFRQLQDRLIHPSQENDCLIPLFFLRSTWTLLLSGEFWWCGSCLRGVNTALRFTYQVKSAGADQMRGTRILRASQKDASVYARGGRKEKRCVHICECEAGPSGRNKPKIRQNVACRKKVASPTTTHNNKQTSKIKLMLSS